MPLYIPQSQNLLNTYNFNPAYLLKIRKAIANVRDGTSNARILCIGDSTTQGTGGTNAATHPWVDTWPTRVATMMNTTVTPWAVGLGIPTKTGAFDDRWTVGTGWSGAGFGWASSAAYTGTAPSGSLVYTPGVNSDRYDVYYLRTGSGGTIGVTATGGSTTNQSTASGTHDVQHLTVAASSTSTSNTVTITGTGGAVYIVGVEPYLNSTKQVLVGNAAVYGASSSTSSWNTAGTGNNWYALDCIGNHAPDLTIIDIGINDAGSSLAVATYVTNMQAIITKCLLSGDVLIKTMVPSQNAPYTTYEPQYVPALYALAALNNCALLDLYKSFNSTYQSTYMNDSLHPTNKGYWDIADSVVAFLKLI